MYVYRLSLRNVNQSKEKKSKNDMPFIFKSISVLSKVNIAKLSPAELFLCTTPFLTLGPKPTKNIVFTIQQVFF